jgi:hypothetical protein
MTSGRFCKALRVWERKIGRGKAPKGIVDLNERFVDE